MPQGSRDSCVTREGSVSKRSSSSKHSSLGKQGSQGSRQNSSCKRSVGSSKRSVSGSKRSDSVQDDLGSLDGSSEELDDLFLRVDKTLALIKPEAMKFEEEIQDIVQENGFEILAKRNIHMTPEQVAGFYKEHFGQPYFANLVIHMSDNPVTVMCLAKENAIEEWLNVIGPTNILEAQTNCPDSIRAKYGTVGEDGEYYNAIHGSKDFANSLREIHFFFPKLIEEPILRGRQVHDYLQERVNSTLLKGLEELCKEKPEDPLIWLADWLLTHNPYSPEVMRGMGMDGISDLEETESQKLLHGTHIVTSGDLGSSVIYSAGGTAYKADGTPYIADSTAAYDAAYGNIASRPCTCTCECTCTKK